MNSVVRYTRVDQRHRCGQQVDSLLVFTHMGCWKPLLGHCAADGFSQLSHRHDSVCTAARCFVTVLGSYRAESPSQTRHEAAQWVENLLRIEQTQVQLSQAQKSSSRGRPCWRTPVLCVEPRLQTGQLRHLCSLAARLLAWPQQFPPCTQCHSILAPVSRAQRKTIIPAANR